MMSTGLFSGMRFFRAFSCLLTPVFVLALSGCGVDNVAPEKDQPDSVILPGITISDVRLTEGDSGSVNAVFAVTLSEATTAAVSVNYETADDSAMTTDSDYTNVTGLVSFAPGETYQAISVPVLGDVNAEADEIFFVNLMNPVNATLADNQATGTILNDDGSAVVVPQISITNDSVTEGDSGTVNAVFTVTLSETTAAAVSVNYETADDSATTLDGDYVAATGTLSFAAGVTSQAISVVVRGDTVVEGDEVFFVNLSDPVNATLSNNQAVATILNDDGVVSGLVGRPSNATCVAPSRPDTSRNVQLERFTTLTFRRPTVMRQAPGDDTRWFVALKAGEVVSFENSADASVTTSVLDISSKVDSSQSETGLLGMAFDPDFQTNRYIYLSYVVYTTARFSVISRFTFSVDGQTIDPASEEVLLTLQQPYSNHNGGNIGFEPEPASGKYLYIGFGDGGSGGDPDGNGQNTETLLGAMLRIDVDVNEADWKAGVRYYIPSDNPFASSAGCGSGGCPEIFAWGLRNPWSWSFDRDTGVLWAGDVGQRDWEEINRIELGHNYGWNTREGAHCYESATCETAGLTDPVVEYANSGSSNCSVTGGYVYRGTTMLGLQGQYIYGDFCSGRVWSFNVGDANPVPQELVTASPYSIAGFAQGHDGEIYVINYGTDGTIQRMVPATAGSTDSFPNKLSQTGCVDPGDPTQVSEGLIPYMINAPFWTDGVEKFRYLSVPDGSTIEINRLNDWIFPIGSVLLKHFRIGGKLIETRLLVRHEDGIWGGYSYEWNDAQTDATFVFNQKEKMIGTQRWQYPSPSQCVACHTEVGGGPLGPETAQMNRDFDYPGTGITANQLQTYEHIGLFNPNLADTPANLPALVDTADTSADLHARARAYLHTNCAQCHQPGGPTPANMDLRYTTADVDMGICNEAPIGGQLEMVDALLVAPGEPDRSMLLNRMSRRDTYGMPPLGSFVADTEGAALLRAWITAMGSSCP